MNSFVRRTCRLLIFRDRKLDPVETYARISPTGVDGMSERGEGLKKPESGECLCPVRF